jgi:hypothetical protein
VVGITHYSKGTTGRDPAERVTGSLAFVAVSRLVMATAKPKDAGESWRLVRAKSNIGPDGGGFEYELERVTINADTNIQGQCVRWGDPLEGSAQALLAEVETPESESDAPRRGAAEVWLVEMLGTGRIGTEFLMKMAEEAGHSWATVKRAKRHLGIKAMKNGLTGGWAWEMPKMLTPSEDAHHKNDEQLSAFEDAHVSAFEDVEDAHQNGVSTLAASMNTLPAKESFQ